MAAILREQGVLDDDDCTLLEALVAKHLKMHGGDPEKSLAAIGVGHSTREGLAQLNDAELTANLARVGTNHATAAGGPVPVHRPRPPVFPGASQGRARMLRSRSWLTSVCAGGKASVCWSRST